ncbi:MAG: hypothetical protein LBS92_06255 [Candidatus Methanoplasma sp.]|jgi:hypothetical protein|nr:hypothetical protein [Candidatus Methanoplasma sp.]
MRFGQEPETLEFKKTTGELNEGAVPIASRLNDHGSGELCFGMNDDGTSMQRKEISEVPLAAVCKALVLECSWKREFITTTVVIRLPGVSVDTAKRILKGSADRCLSTEPGNNKTRKHYAKRRDAMAVGGGQHDD